MTMTMTMISRPTIVALCFSSSFSTPHHRPIPSKRSKSIAHHRTPPMAAIAASAEASIYLLEAAKHTVDSYVTSGMVIGLGSGRASGLSIQYLGRRLREGSLTDVLGIPSVNDTGGHVNNCTCVPHVSFTVAGSVGKLWALDGQAKYFFRSVSSASEAAKAGIPLDDYQDNLQIDFAFLDADIIEEGTLSAVTGRRKLDGCESIIDEKSIMTTAGNLALIVAEKQYTTNLDGSIPVVVKMGNWMRTAEEIDDLFLGDAEVWRRPTSGHADPLGGNYPLVTPEGHHILDVIFTSPILNLAQVAKSLDEIDGIVDHGVIAGIPCTVVIASKDGVVMVDNFSKMPS